MQSCNPSRISRDANPTECEPEAHAAEVVRLMPRNLKITDTDCTNMHTHRPNGTYWSAKRPVRPCRTGLSGQQNGPFYNTQQHKPLGETHHAAKYSYIPLRHTAPWRAGCPTPVGWRQALVCRQNKVGYKPAYAIYTARHATVIGKQNHGQGLRKPLPVEDML